MASSANNAICTSLHLGFDLRFRAILFCICNMQNTGNPKSSDQLYPLSGRKFLGLIIFLNAVYMCSCLYVCMCIYIYIYTAGAKKYIHILRYIICLLIFEVELNYGNNV